MTHDYSQLDAADVLYRCAGTADSQAWEEFLRRFHPLVVSVALRTARRYTPAASGMVDDLTQDVYLKLSAHDGQILRGFVSRYPGSAFGFIKVVTANVVHDYFKAKGRSRLDETLPESLGSEDNLDWVIMQHQIQNLLARHASAAECRIFDLYYRQGLTAQEIATLPFGLSAKGVESLLMRLKKLIRAELDAPPCPLAPKPSPHLPLRSGPGSRSRRCQTSSH